MATLYITHPACYLHNAGQWHPESPERLDAIHDQLLADGLIGLLAERDARIASDADLLRVHTARHLAYLRSIAPAQGYVEIDPDTLMNSHTLEAALAAAGSGLTAVDAIMQQQAETAFCAVRPPGHHAERNRAMGFCFFNNVAVSVAYVLDKYKLERVAIIDIDVHHGNGTEEIFAGDPRVLMCGFFQQSLFPNASVIDSAENMVNIPLDARADGQVVRRLVDDVWLARLRQFKPQFVFMSAGFDAHRDDDMGQLGLVEADYAWITQQVVALADQMASGRIVSFLEGGYNSAALGRSVVAHIKALAKL